MRHIVEKRPFNTSYYLLAHLDDFVYQMVHCNRRTKWKPFFQRTRRTLWQRKQQHKKRPIQPEEVYENAQGMKVIKVQLAGEQTKHTETGLVEGANIVVNCNVTVGDMEQNASSNIVMRYSNEQNVQYDNNGISETTLNYIVKEENKEEQAVGAVPTEEVEPQATDDPITVTKSISSGNGADIYETQVQKYTITVKNNTDETISNITIEDDIPAELVYAESVTNFGFKNNYTANENVTKYIKIIETVEARKEMQIYD